MIYVLLLLMFLTASCVSIEYSKYTVQPDGTIEPTVDVDVPMFKMRYEW